ncbi:MAG: TonB-dependent receptor, partial [Acidobacteriota bacterium]
MTNYRSITRLAMGLLGGLLLGVLPCATAWADGTQTGILAGSVYDARQTPLQGVEVRLTGPQIQRQVVTDANGSFRFLALGVGSYEIAADLLGLKARQRDVGVYVDQTTEIDLTLTESPVEEEPAADVEDWIQVVAEAPVIDRFDFGVGANVSFDFLDELPVRRFYQSVATLLPGVSGGEDGNPNVSGGLRNSNLFLIDGVDTTDPTTGLFGLNLTYEAVQAVQVTTAASPPQYGRASGAVINVVTRSGTNEFQGLARWVVTNNEWNDDYDYPADQIRHLGNEVAAADAGPDQVDSTIALSLGGPLAPERLFFFAAFENSDRSFLRPTLTGPNWDEDSAVESTAFKLTWQANASHTLVAQHTADDARVAAFQPFDREPLENRLPQTPAALNNASVDRLP